jgi:hypothetical protein
MIGDVAELSAEELDKLPNYLSGLPTSPILRAEALEAWKEGGLSGLNKWRRERRERLSAKRPVTKPYQGTIQ